MNKTDTIIHSPSQEWVPGKRGAYDERVRWSKEVQEWTTVVLQRDRLAACLLAEIREQFPSQVMGEWLDYERWGSGWL